MTLQSPETRRTTEKALLSSLHDTALLRAGFQPGQELNASFAIEVVGELLELKRMHGSDSLEGQFYARLIGAWDRRESGYLRQGKDPFQASVLGLIDELLSLMAFYNAERGLN